MKALAEGNLDKWKVVLSSCTQYEKENPEVIRKTRIARIAQGSGSTYTEIKQMLKQYNQMKGLMKNMLGKKRRGKKGQQQGGMPGMPGMPGMDGGGGMPNMGDIAQMQQMMGAGKKKRKKHPW